MFVSVRISDLIVNYINYVTFDMEEDQEHLGPLLFQYITYVIMCKVSFCYGLTCLKRVCDLFPTFNISFYCLINCIFMPSKLYTPVQVRALSGLLVMRTVNVLLVCY